MRTLPILALLLAAPAFAEGKARTDADAPAETPTTSRSAASPASLNNAMALRAAIGVTGPLAMQYTTFDLGADLDVPLSGIGERVYVSPGFHLSLVTHRVALEPLVDLKKKWAKPIRSFLLVPYAGGGLGLNLGFNRGSTDFGLAFRGLGGLTLMVSQWAGVTTELALELGPLIAPGAALQGAFRWNIGAEFLF